MHASIDKIFDRRGWEDLLYVQCSCDIGTLMVTINYISIQQMDLQKADHYYCMIKVEMNVINLVLDSFMHMLNFWYIVHSISNVYQMIDCNTNDMILNSSGRYSEDV